MTNLTVFDIETCSLLESEILPLAPEFTAPGNFKDPVKIAANIEEQRKAWLERAALSPVTGKVIAIGVCRDGKITMSIEPDKETMLLASFWLMVRTEWSISKFVGFNIKRFDLPFLVRRSWKLNIPVPPHIRRGRYWDDAFIDLYEEWQLGDYQSSISLDNLSKFLGIGQKSGSGADFAGLPRDKQEEYLAHDLELTAKAAEIMLPKE